jgi:hypothetical protein
MKRFVCFRPTGTVIGFFMIAVLVSGCGGGGGSGGGGGLQPTLSSIWLNVFSMTCVSGCHEVGGVGFAATGLDLSTQQLTFDGMVGVPSAEVPAILRVAPGDPGNSYLIDKLELSPEAILDQMPLGALPLDDATIDVIRDWITDGAEND